MARLARYGDESTRPWRRFSNATLFRYLKRVREQLRQECMDHVAVAREAWLARNHDHVRALRSSGQYAGLAALEANLAKVQGLFEPERVQVQAHVKVEELDASRLSDRGLEALEVLARDLQRSLPPRR